MTCYAGACHCGRVRFRVEAHIDRVRVCDCSICRRRGGLMVRVPDEHLWLLTPWTGLSVYRWGSGTAADYFCPICGILPFRRPSRPTAQELRAGLVPFTGWAVNVRCLEGVDLDRLPVTQIHGSAIRLGD